MQRTAGVDLAAARAAAAADPPDVEAAITVADLDVLGGHVEDAFTRLLDLVGPRPGTSATRPAPTSSTCSTSWATTTSACARAAPP